ncbi:hypothetical protein RHECNPAF_2530076 [Rhizobium etli CNPAF512]|nr:hypothetical protein RHECNPAF_2530076 [Rhizobium etli CNPAF512]
MAPAIQANRLSRHLTRDKTTVLRMRIEAAPDRLKRCSNPTDL